MICSNCRVLMRYVMRFEDGKAFRLRRCPKCYHETRPAPLYFEDEKTTQQSRKEQTKPKKAAATKPKVSLPKRKKAKKR